MTSAPRCADCDKRMEKGFVPDATRNVWDRAQWHRGEVVAGSFLGIPTGVKVDKSEAMPIVAWRCPSCGLVRMYAHEAEG